MGPSVFAFYIVRAILTYLEECLYRHIVIVNAMC